MDDEIEAPVDELEADDEEALLGDTYGPLSGAPKPIATASCAGCH